MLPTTGYKLLLSAFSVFVAFSFYSTAWACTDPEYKGQIEVYDGQTCPQEHLAADGRLVKIDDHPFLFSLFGTRFEGGDGKTTFALPNLNSQSASSGRVFCIATHGIYPPRT